MGAKCEPWFWLVFWLMLSMRLSRLAAVAGSEFPERECCDLEIGTAETEVMAGGGEGGNGGAARGGYAIPDAVPSADTPLQPHDQLYGASDSFAVDTNHFPEFIPELSRNIDKTDDSGPHQRNSGELDNSVPTTTGTTENPKDLVEYLL